MKDLLLTVVRPLVSNQDAISINQIDQGNTVILELRVDSADMGKVIGKQGRRAQAIRSIVKARGTRQGKRVVVDII